MAATRPPTPRMAMTRRVSSAAGHHEADHNSDQQQEERVGVGGLHGPDSQAGSPPPPGQGVDGATAGDGAVHPSPVSSPGLRLHLSQAAPPSSAMTTTTTMIGSAGSPPAPCWCAASERASVDPDVVFVRPFPVRVLVVVL